MRARRILMIVAVLLLSGCGETRRQYDRDGVCYVKSRMWILGVTVMSDDGPCP